MVDVMEKTGIQEACEKAGGQTDLAKLMGITPQAVQQMVAKGFAPVDRLIEIEALTGISRERLCDPKIADLFGPRI